MRPDAQEVMESVGSSGILTEGTASGRPALPALCRQRDHAAGGSEVFLLCQDGCPPP